jgi:hypothetical protein
MFCAANEGRRCFLLCCSLFFAGQSKRLSLRELYSLWTEQVPCFPVLVVHASFAVVATAEQEAGGSQEGFEGEYVPGVFGDDVGGEEMDFSALVGDGAASDAAGGR